MKTDAGFSWREITHQSGRSSGLRLGTRSVQPTMPVTTENMKAIAVSHRISPISVPSRDEIIDPILVIVVDLLSVVILARTLPCSLGCV